MNIGDAAPLPCTAPCRGLEGDPQYDQSESPYAVRMKCFILHSVVIIHFAIFSGTPNLCEQSDTSL